MYYWDIDRLLVIEIIDYMIDIEIIDVSATG